MIYNKSHLRTLENFALLFYYYSTHVFLVTVFLTCLSCSNKERLSLMSGGHCSAGDADFNSGCKSHTCPASDASYGVGGVLGGSGGGAHVGEIFLFLPFPPGNSRRRAAFSEDAFKVAPVQTGVGVTEGLMWAQSAL